MKFYRLKKSDGSEKRSSNLKSLERQQKEDEEIEEIDEQEIENEKSKWWHGKRGKK